MKDYKSLADTELVKLLKSSDYAAFTEIYNRYQSLLYIYAYKKMNDKEESKDIIQEVFIQLWKSRSDFQVYSTLSGYLYKVVLNKVLNQFKHKKITQQYIKSFSAIVPMNGVKTDYLIREKDISALIEQEINALPEKMREVFQLRRKQYLSNKAIADQLGISEHTVATQIKRALKILKGRLGILIYISCFICKS
jgi:RNA polymerase sigma-70 factor (family 1)